MNVEWMEGRGEWGGGRVEGEVQRRDQVQSGWWSDGLPRVQISGTPTLLPFDLRSRSPRKEQPCGNPER